MKAFIVALLLFTTAAAAAPVIAPPGGYPCNTLRLGVWLYGLDRVIAEARARGYTTAQINAARKACK